MAKGLMYCPECVYKHLRDAEHHLEDMVRVTNASERKFWNSMIDDIRAIRKDVMNFMVKNPECLECDDKPKKVLKEYNIGAYRVISTSEKQALKDLKRVIRERKLGIAKPVLY